MNFSIEHSIVLNTWTIQILIFIKLAAIFCRCIKFVPGAFTALFITY
jgi:hypothetical protein